VRAGLWLWVTEYRRRTRKRCSSWWRSIVGAPFSGCVILDYHWEERFHNFHWRPSLFPRRRRCWRAYASWGQAGPHLHPFVNNRNVGWKKTLLNVLFHNAPAGAKRMTSAHAQYEEAKARAIWPIRSGLCSAQVVCGFHQPQAADWWNACCARSMSGAWPFSRTTMASTCPRCRSALGMDANEYHNLYGLFYGKAIYEGMAALDERRPLIYAARCGRVAAYPPLLGDQKPTFDTSALRCAPG